MRRICFLLLSVLAASLLAGCATASKPAPDLHTVAHVDLDRYMGRWYVISHTPYILEKGKVASSDNYSARPDGRMNNVFAFRKGSLDAPEETWNGVATVVNKETNAEWKVQFIWPISSTYLLLDLDPTYRWALVSSGGGGIIWVLARDTSIPAPTYQEILGLIAKRGLDGKNLEMVPQITAVK